MEETSLSEQLRGSGLSGKDLAARVNEILRSDNGLYGILDFELVNLGDGTAEFTLPLTDAARRRGGVVHGGVVSYALDSACGIAVMTQNKGIDQYTVELKINFLRKLSSAPFRVVGRTIKVGSHLASAEGEIRDAEGKLCALALGTWFIVGVKSKSGEPDH